MKLAYNEPSGKVQFDAELLARLLRTEPVMRSMTSTPKGESSIDKQSVRLFSAAFVALYILSVDFSR